MLSKTPNAQLNQLNTLGFAAQANWLVQAEQPEDLPEVFDFASSQALPVFPLGGGSNVILQGNLKAVVLQQQPLPLEWPEIEPDNLILKVPAGYAWQQLVLDTTRKGYFGLENLALIPGQAGAAPIQNIGAYGVELADTLQAVEGYWLPEAGQGKPAKFDVIDAKDCALGYRDSRFKHDWKGRFVITALQLQLSKQAEPRLGYADLQQRLAIKQQQPEATNVPLPQLIAQVVTELRQAKLPDPAKIGNAGSFFKNPVISQQQAAELLKLYPKMPCYPATNPATNGCKIAAAWLIDQCGFKGAKRGSVGVHDQQALVLIHTGGGTAENLLALAEAITSAVKNRFNIQLEREPELVSVDYAFI